MTWVVCHGCGQEERDTKNHSPTRTILMGDGERLVLVKTRTSLSAVVVQVGGMVSAMARRQKHLARAKCSCWEKQEIRWATPQRALDTPGSTRLLSRWSLTLSSIQTPNGYTSTTTTNPIRKRAKDLRKHFFREGIRVACKSVRRRPNVTDHQGSANHNHHELSPHSREDGCYYKRRRRKTQQQQQQKNRK